MFDIDLRLSAGRCHVDARFETSATRVGLVGPSGVGKTTLLRALAGVHEPDDGHIRIAGTSFREGPESVPAHRRSVGWSPQDFRLFPHLDVRQNLSFGAVRDEFDLVAESLQIESLLSRKPRYLSGGERQRVAIGRALLAAESLVILDEPFASLNSELRRQVAQFVSGYTDRHGIPLLMASHDVSTLEAMDAEIWLLSDGQLGRLG